MNTLPVFIGHKYRPIEVLNLNEIHSTYAEHRRLRVFHNKGCVCVQCGVEGTQLIKAVDHSGGIHIDVYTDGFRLMTIDHILPKSKGGLDHLDNLQPMCTNCNSKKGNKTQ